jgi:hypothetical protein
MVKRLMYIIICGAVLSCGSKKKTFTKTEKKIEIKETLLINQKKSVTDSSTTYFNIETLSLVSLDSTLPIKIIDSKGNTTTFYNVKVLTTIKDKTTLKTSIKDIQSNVLTSTAGVTTTLNTEVKSKVKIDTTFIYIGIGLVVLFILAKFYKKYLTIL